MNLSRSSKHNQQESRSTFLNFVVVLLIFRWLVRLWLSSPSWFDVVLQIPNHMLQLLMTVKHFGKPKRQLVCFDSNCLMNCIDVARASHVDETRAQRMCWSLFGMLFITFIRLATRKRCRAPSNRSQPMKLYPPSGMKQSVVDTGKFSLFRLHISQFAVILNGFERCLLRDTMVSLLSLLPVTHICVGMSCPRLPEKRVMNQGADFIQERMVGLNAFMRRLMSNPYFRKDKTVEMFLSIRDSTAWEQMKKGVKSGDGSDPSSNEGLHHWFGCLQHYEMPIDADAAVSEFTSHCEAMEKCVQSALRASSSYFQALKSVASEYVAVFCVQLLINARLGCNC